MSQTRTIFSLCVLLMLCGMAYATSDVSTESLGVATKIRYDAATLTPAAASWNPDGAGNFGTYWFASATEGYSATYPFTAEQAKYDIYLQIKTGPNLSTSVPFRVNFRVGGSYELGPDERVAAVDETQAALGRIICSVNMQGDTFPNTAFVYLGRFEMAAGATSVVCDVAGATGPSDTHIPVSIWFAKTQINFGTLAYNDYNSVPAGWINTDTTEFGHYWENSTNNTDVFRASQFFPFPTADRIPSAVYRVNFTHFTLWHAQNAEVPLQVYFRPGGQYQTPSVGGFITNVDTTSATVGLVRVTVKWPTTTASGPPFPQNTFSLGEYEFDARMYGAKLNNYPTASTGEGFGPEVFSLEFVRTLAISSAKHWTLY